MGIRYENQLFAREFASASTVNEQMPLARGLAHVDNFQPVSNLNNYFSEVRKLVDSTLDELVPSNDREPSRLYQAIRWSLFGEGKRFRPALVIAVGRVFGAPDAKLLRTAAGIEMIHTYSLIHDDLPAMDDDDFRRGRETCHRRFGEATAILAGDALQALAFQAISDDDSLSENTRIKLVSGLANAAADMVSGQQRDLEAEGRQLTLEEIGQVHRSKTGSLIRYSAMAGAIIAGANEPDLNAIAKYGSSLGLLFQITDDLLDVTQTSETLGKTAGKDLAAHKATYPSHFGIEKARDLANELYLSIIADLTIIERQTDLLKEMADRTLKRQA